MAFVNTSSVLTALQAKLESLVFPAGSPLAGQPLFERVDVYDIPRLETALKDLLNFKDRICLIVPRPERFAAETKGCILHCRKSQQYLLIISDKDYGPGKPAYFGSATQPGVLAIKDMVITELLGASLDLAHVILSPIDGESLRVAESERQLQQSREGYCLTLETPMGVEKTTLSSAQRINQ